MPAAGNYRLVPLRRCEPDANEGDYFGEIMEMMRTDIIGEQGCHLTWPELRHLTRQELELSWSVIQDREVDFTDLPSYYCAIVNLQGFVRYRLDDEAGAEDTFRRLLEVDAANICALGNLAVVCYRDSRFVEHEEYLDRLRTVIARRTPLSRARSYYDRAHTIRHFEQDKRKFTYISFIEKAVEISKGLVERERSEWQFDYGLALYRRDTQLTMGKASTALLESGFGDSSKCFHAVITNEGHLGYRALSWTFLGILLLNQPGRKFEVTLPEIDDLHGMTAVHCFNKALGLAPSHPIVLRRVGSEMTKLKDFDRAKTLLDASLKQDLSWFAYRHRGLLNLALYEHSVSEKKGNTDSRFDYLKQALKDFKEALKRKKVHADYSDLGYVMYLLGERRSAVAQYSCAVKCPRDDFFNPEVTHRRWARCLRDMGESKGALFQEGKAEEVREALMKDAKTIPDRFIGHGLGCRGFECDLERFNYSSQDMRGFVNILSEDRNPVSPIGHSLSFMSRHHSDYKYDFFISFSHIDHKWALLFFRKLERELQIRGCIRYRDYECGNAISSNIVSSIRKSAKVLVIISPDSLVDQWCRYEVQLAHTENLRRNYPCVIPIMLRLCKIPEEFELMTYLKCQDGQFTVDDWYRLGKGLQKKPEP